MIREFKLGQSAGVSKTLEEASDRLEQVIHRIYSDTGRLAPTFAHPPQTWRGYKERLDYFTFHALNDRFVTEASERERKERAINDMYRKKDDKDSRGEGSD